MTAQKSTEYVSRQMSCLDALFQFLWTTYSQSLDTLTVVKVLPPRPRFLILCPLRYAPLETSHLSPILSSQITYLSPSDPR
jgi:hypothetical protein